jgi:predicted DNA-binding transcriptional regulator AlpA
METHKLMDTSAAAERLGVSAALLIKFRLQGGGPKYIKMGRSVRYSADSLAAWLTANERQSTSDTGQLSAAR